MVTATAARNFNITTLCSDTNRYYTLNVPSEWLINSQWRRPRGEVDGRGPVSGSGFGWVILPIFFFFGCAGVRFWTAELPACKSIENNLLLLIISERSCAHACGEGLSGEGHRTRGLSGVEMISPESVGPKLTTWVLGNLPQLVIDHVFCPFPLAIRFRSVLFACEAQTNKQINIQTRPRLLTVVP